MSERILIVDDEHDIADLLEVYLRNENYTVYKYYSAKEALACIESKEIDLAILDIMLPDINGFSICQKIREKHTYPIIMLTAKDEETDKITGLTLGADDYVTKPFRPLELIARVKAQLRRYHKYSPTQRQDMPAAVLTYKKLSLNTQTYECVLDGEIIPLTPTEFSVLRILLEKQGVVVSLEDLFHSVWKDEYYSKNSSTITVHIRHLREKLRDTAEKPKYIKTIWGVAIEDSLNVTGDPEKLARVFNNLLKNAAAYSYPDTEISISSERKEKNIVIIFQNHGQTIEEDQLSGIFEKFNRLDEARLSDTGGVGLGLSIAREIINLHGGEIIAQCKNETVTFIITLPVAS